VLDIPTATLILTAGVACVTSYIAIQQWLTAKNKFRLDLFDRRSPVFEAAMRLAAAAVNKPNVTSDDLSQFEIAARGVRFLFNRSLEDYCNELHKEAVRMILDKRNLDRLPVGDERTRIAKLLTWGY
jgi:hypothetical protein